MMRSIIGTLVGLFFLLSFSANPPQGRTGAPGERTCSSSGCHLPENPLTDGQILLEGLPTTLEQGVTYPILLHLIADQGEPARGGFQLTALTASEEPVDIWDNPGESSTLSESGGKTYFEHDPAKNFEDGDTVIYTVDLNYQGTSTEDIIIYIAANFANGDRSRLGDQIIVHTDTLRQSSASTIEVSINSISPSCGNTSDGSVTAVAMGGTPPYTYEWDTGMTSGDLQNISIGDYTVTVTDAEGTQATQSIDLPSLDTIPPTLSCVSNMLNISTCTPFSYPQPSVEDECGDATLRLISGLGSNSSFPPNLTLDIYEAQDASGNISLCTITVNNDIFIDASFDVTNLACHDSEFGSVEISVSGTNGPFDISIEGETLPDSLPEGSYTAMITDDTGCIDSLSFDIRRPDSLYVDIVEIIEPINTTSGDGSIDIEGEGGTPPYTYCWRIEDEDFTKDEDLSLLFPGVYALQVIDSRGCRAVPDTIRLDAVTYTVDIDLADHLSIYPNPTTDIIYIDNLSGISIKEMILTDIAGRRIYSASRSINQLDLTSLNQGSYILSVISDDNRIGAYHFRKW